MLEFMERVTNSCLKEMSESKRHSLCLCQARSDTTCSAYIWWGSFQISPAMLILAYIRFRSEQPYDSVNKLRLSCAKLSTVWACYSLGISHTFYAIIHYYTNQCTADHLTGSHGGFHCFVSLYSKVFPFLSNSSEIFWILI